MWQQFLDHHEHILKSSLAAVRRDHCHPAFDRPLPAAAEPVDRGDLTEEHARRIGRQGLRDNALALFPQLQDRPWKGKRQPAPGRLPEGTAVRQTAPTLAHPREKHP